VKKTDKFDKLPILRIDDVVLFPSIIQPVLVKGKANVNLVNDALIGSRVIGIFTAPAKKTRKSRMIGCAANILKMFQQPGGELRIIVQGVERIELIETVETEPYEIAEIVRLETIAEEDSESQALFRTAREMFIDVVQKSPFFPDEIESAVYQLDEESKLADFIASNLTTSVEEKRAVLYELNIRERLEMVIGQLHKELKLLELTGRIQDKINSELNKSQRDYFLREQLKAIQQELGEEEPDAWESEIDDLGSQIEKAGMPEKVLQTARKELERLQSMPPASPEYTISRTYLDYLIALPWHIKTDDRIDLIEARKILNKDHFDLSEVKDRILEFLAVKKLRGKIRGPILCFVGPPGVGKTSLGKSIARSLGRKFYRFSLGGVRDEAEIRGHRRTYIGALPGRILQGMKEVGTINPVFMLDEIDKISSDFRGDPASALLEALDPQQNSEFMDHYLDVKYDLSEVFFICTANVDYAIPDALYDRMEVIEIPGYIAEDKLEIAKRYLIPRQIEENGLKKSDIKINKTALRKIISDYTQEAGVRELERKIAGICRKVARRFAEDNTDPVTVTPDNLEEFLGRKKKYSEMASAKDQIGIATGLAWTPVGGEILFVESSIMKGARGVTTTGQLGDVMRESATAAVNYIRANVEKYGIDENYLEDRDIHIHIPAGATPKDGPSAGVTLATSLLSLLLGKPVDHKVAMTGEISLRGRVMPVGGVKEKILAAYRAGIKEVVLPKDNEADLDEVPEKVREKIKFHLVESLEEVFALAIRGYKLLVPDKPKRTTVSRKADGTTVTAHI
jgi:ATP-dependent Lon protease